MSQIIEAPLHRFEAQQVVETEYRFWADVGRTLAFGGRANAGARAREMEEAFEKLPRVSLQATARVQAVRRYDAPDAIRDNEGVLERVTASCALNLLKDSLIDPVFTVALNEGETEADPSTLVTLTVDQAAVVLEHVERDELYDSGFQIGFGSGLVELRRIAGKPMVFVRAGSERYGIDRTLFRSILRATRQRAIYLRDRFEPVGSLATK